MWYDKINPKDGEERMSTAQETLFVSSQELEKRIWSLLHQKTVDDPKISWSYAGDKFQADIPGIDLALWKSQPAIGALTFGGDHITISFLGCQVYSGLRFFNRRRTHAKKLLDNLGVSVGVKESSLKSFYFRDLSPPRGVRESYQRLIAALEEF